LFNGVQHPTIAIRHEDGSLEVVRRFGFEDYQSRLS
jgi:carboxynorspermidine decarboxylase